MQTTDLIELGLVKACGEVIVSEYRGHITREFCGAETIVFGGKCSKHDNTAELTRQGKIASEKTVLAQRRYIEDVLFPKLTKRIEGIIEDDSVRPADIIKIWTSVMDRVGMGAVQGLVLEGEMKLDAPLDILRAMLRPQTMEVLDAEVLELEG